MSNVWDRTAEESEIAWALFRDWRDHVLPRPSAAAWCRERGRPTSTFPREHGWDSRALAWDQFLDSRKQDATVTATQEMARRHISLSQRMLDLVDKNMVLLEDQVERLIAMRPNEMSRMVDVAAKLERLSRGEATERVEGPDYSHLSDKDLQILEEIANRAEGGGDPSPH